MKIPRDRLRIRFVRSSGPGGQNVNKVATKAEVRFRVDDAEWIPAAWRERLKTQQRHRINRRGDFLVVSSRYRTRERNLEDCLQKLARYLAEARKAPKRRLRTKPSRASKEARLRVKKQRGETKRARRWRADED